VSQVETPIARGSRVQRQAFIMGLRDRRSKQAPPYGARDRQPSIWLLSYQGDLALTLVSLFSGSASAFGRAACMAQRLLSMKVLSAFTLLWLS